MIEFLPPEPNFPVKEEWFVVFWDENTFTWKPFGPVKDTYPLAQTQLAARRATDSGKEWRVIKVTHEYAAYKPHVTPSTPRRGTHATPVHPEAV